MSTQIQGLSVRLGRELVIDDVSIEIPGRQRLAIMGPSGAGKTTLLRAIAGLEPPSAGKIVIDGRDITREPPHRRPVGLMFQEFALFPHLSVAGNVDYGLRMAGMPKVERRTTVDAMLELVGLSGYGRRSTSELSGGERQRVALARTLAPGPALVLLDEPLGSVDLMLKDGLLDDLRSILDRVAATSVYVTHDRTEAEAFADRVAIMKDGRLVRSGTPSGVWDDPGTEFVARFLGHGGIVDGPALSLGAGQHLIHAHAVTIGTGPHRGSITSCTFRDGRYRIAIDVKGSIVEALTDRPIAEGDRVSFDFPSSAVRALGEGSGESP